ncbi:flavin reductase family protein [Sphingobium sp. SA2]|uniref:flavin reductase family protein n=1 Tax=unclassified Sphingobium TaxID=2611147 RepID=UPI000BB59888|nr:MULTISPECIES: flavin reductase family protein [unclassified Sphingobium]MDT7532131.1 flavin reductase family protein [Sphingobium sp. SA2]PBN45242.1 nitrilotriacetate monooxygenase [Sphingobium sp. D43FB]
MGLAFDQRAFRNALGHFPTGVVVVTAETEGRDPIAMTVSSFNAVSLDPPLVLFSVGRTAPSLPALLAARNFGISVLRHDQSDLSSRFAGGRGEKWAGLAPVLGETGCPLIGPCLATFECAPFAVHEGGDHLIVVGHVLRFEIAEEGEPLVFFRGGYHAIAGRAA